MGIDMEYGIRVVDMVIHHIDMVILDIDMGYGISIWEMTVSIRSSWISIWDILSLCLEVARVRALLVHEARAHVAVRPARAGGSRVDGVAGI